MMLLTVAVAAIGIQSPSLTGGEIFTKMLTRYHQASSIKGTIAFTQSTEGVKVQVLTTVQREAPNLFFLEQVRVPKSSEPDANNNFLGVSDGKKMGYTVPKGFLPWTDASSGKHRRMLENAPKTADEGLNAFCTMLVDRSLPVAIALYNAYEIERVTNRLTNLKVVSEDFEYNGKPAYRIDGQYIFVYAKPSKNQPAIKTSATIVIDKEFNLHYLAWEEPLGTPQGQTINVKSEWAVNFTVNPTGLDKNLYTVR